MMTEHAAVLTPRRPRNIRRLEVAVRCSCGAKALLLAYGCEFPGKCTGTTHVRGGSSKAGRAGECPAVVAVVRCLDDSLSRAQAEGIARNGPGAAP